MRCWSIEIELGGRMYDVPALPAADWWPVLAEDDLGRILDMIGSSSDDLDERLLGGEITSAEVGDTLIEAIEEVAGRSFHVAYVTAVVAGMSWAAVGGELALRGFRWDVMPLAAALDAIHLVLLRGMDEDGRRKFEAVLRNESLTTKGKKPSPRQREKVISEFEAMAGPRPTAGVRASAEPSGSEPPRTQRPLRRPRPPGRSRVPTRPREQPAGSDPPATS
jgi:hypothetical protein